MVEIDNPNAISVYMEYDPEYQVTAAQLIWSDLQPREVYSIDLSNTLSASFDMHTPVHPTLIRQQTETTDVNLLDYEITAQLFGEEFSDAMIQTRRSMGTIMLGLTLDYAKRQRIARLQTGSPSTPPLLKHACSLMTA